MLFEPIILKLFFFISAERDVEDVINHLDFREREGYTRKTVLFHPQKRIKSSMTDNSSNDILNANSMKVHEGSEERPFYLTM